MEPQKEYRVAYRRQTWREGQTGYRYFQTENSAIKFIAKLYSGNRAELSAIEICEIESREVGEWRK